jgi:hypothetical protein
VPADELERLAYDGTSQRDDLEGAVERTWSSGDEPPELVSDLGQEGADDAVVHRRKHQSDP